MREATHTEGRAVGAHAVVRQLDALLHDLLSLFLFRRLKSKAGKEKGKSERLKGGKRCEEKKGRVRVRFQTERSGRWEVTGRLWAAE